MNRYLVSMDIGGTFTDFVLLDQQARQVAHGKVLSTPHDPAEGVLAGIRQLVDDPAEIGFIVHGTTVGLNAFLERRGTRVLLITTAGVRDSYTIARGDRKELYALHYRKPERLVPRRDVHEVRERLRWDGSVLEPLHPSDFEPIVAKILAQGIEAVAVCFLHAYVNPAHELRAREILTQAIPGLSVTLSHEVAREWREYERASTAVLNAYIAPMVERYLTSLQIELASLGVTAPLHVMQSNGGVMTAAAALAHPVQTLLSGPVGGTSGGAALTRSLGRPNLVCVDMGGTSFDLSLIINGTPSVTMETELEGLPVLLPLVEIHTIGAGGGSLAWVEAGALRVGPRSAGASPGPACYGRGGTQPTVTDANLFLGRLQPSSFLGGRMILDEARAARAITELAAYLDMDAMALAEGILAIVNAAMADAMRTVTIRQGIDPRAFTLVAFGGAGPMHAVWLARELGIAEIIIPPSPGTFSAWGMLTADMRHDLCLPFYRALAGLEAGDVARGYDQLEAQGRAVLEQQAIAPENMYFTRSADMRYVGQEYTVLVSVGSHRELAALAGAFHDAHQTHHGHATPEAPVEIVNLRVAAMGRLQGEPVGLVPPVRDREPVLGRRPVVFERVPHETTILARSGLVPQDCYAGPLVIVEDTATTVVPPGHGMRVDEIGNLVITTM